MDMSARPHVCPVLVGRDDLLALAARRIDEVMAGTGHCLVLAGEAGVGKTRLLGAIERMAVARGFQSVRAGAYPSDLHVAAGILIDLARAMGRLATLAGTGARLHGLLDKAASEPGDPARRRRLLVLDVAELLADLVQEPLLIQMEDIHWSDDLTLEVLEALARRIPERRILLVVTYRSDEVLPRTPMRQWRSRLVAQRMIEEVRLARLSPADTASMTTLLLGSPLPAPRDLIEAVHQRTDGIPLHVEEVLGLLGSPGDAGAPVDAAGDQLRASVIRGLGVPQTLDDAVVRRFEQRSSEAQAVARAGAVIGRSFDLDLLVDVTGLPPETLSAPLAELADHAILLPAATPGRYEFRHALICDALYARIPELERRRLHGRTAAAAGARPDVVTSASLALHHERAGERAAAYRAALEGARSAAALSSHAEADQLYRAAIRNAPRTPAAEERAALWEGHAHEAAAVDDNVTADAAFHHAHAAYLEAGDTVAAASVVAPWVSVRHLLGDDLETRVGRLRSALETIGGSAAAPADAGPAVDAVRGRLLAALAAASMLDRRLDIAIADGEAANAIAATVNDRRTAQHAEATIGTCLVFAGETDRGWAMLESTTDAALADQHEAEAARGYRMSGSCASVLVEYDRAERWLRDGIVYAESVERWNDRHYMAAHLAHTMWARGRWDEAEDVARHALADGRGGITTRVTALHVLGFVALGRDQLDQATEHLDEARSLGTTMRELQRLGPALWGLAEVALRKGDPDRAMDLTETGRRASAAVRDTAYRFPFLVTGTRAALDAGDTGRARSWAHEEILALRARDIPGTRPAIDHAVGLVQLAEGGTRQARVALTAAHAGWLARGRIWEGTWAAIDLARASLRSNQRGAAARLAASARETALQLPAPALRIAAEAVARAVGSRGDIAVPWAPLTAREFEVARAVALGRTNVEIAIELGIARKTVAAHIEHILAKLGVGRRAEIAAWTATRPVLHSRPHGRDREE